MKNIIHGLNNELIKELKIYFDANYSKYIRNDKIIYWDEYDEKSMLQYVKGSTPQKGDVSKIMVKMSYAMGKLLGFRSDVDYVIYADEYRRDMQARYTSLPSCGIQYLYTYCDIIHPSRFGSQMVNILDCFTFQNGTNKGIHNTIYKGLKTSFIDEISIKVTDQNGGGINFIEGSSITCVLHIRPK